MSNRCLFCSFSIFSNERKEINVSDLLSSAYIHCTLLSRTYNSTSTPGTLLNLTSWRQFLQVGYNSPLTSSRLTPLHSVRVETWCHLHTWRSTAPSRRPPTCNTQCSIALQLHLEEERLESRQGHRLYQRCPRRRPPCFLAARSHICKYHTYTKKITQQFRKLGTTGGVSEKF